MPLKSASTSAMTTVFASPSKSGSSIVGNNILLPPLSPTSNTLRVHLPNGGFNVVKYGQQTRVREIIQVVTNRLAAIPRPCLKLFGLFVQLENEMHWLPLEKSLCKARDRLEKGQTESARYELRVRYFPVDLKELHDKDRVTFVYIYDQVRNEYLESVAETTDPEIAIQLGCLEIRRFFKDMPHIALDKKSNFDYLEKEVGLRKFFPEAILQQWKPRSLRKAIQICFKEFAPLSESECILRFFDILKSVYRFDQEAHKCSLGSNWSVPINLVVSSETGLAYTIEHSAPTQLAQLKDIVNIRTSSEGPSRFVIQIRVEGADEMLTLSCPSSAVCDDIADLINGYCKLETGVQREIWSKESRESRRQSFLLAPHMRSQSGGSDRKSGTTLDSHSHSDYAEVVENLEGDYSAPLDDDYVVERSGVSISALDVIGEGHFGNVYRGAYTLKTGEKIPVAVKACKESADRSTTEKFLEEAYIMKQFEHPHIIRLIGVCPEVPIWIVMELAIYGELRAYMLNNRNRLSLPILVLYCYQLSTALSYLESKNYVHRDIAARNILVADYDMIKLADFGLSRWIEDESYYTASKGKLPIKWMAPESINFRRFTSASDVWMFAVCMWEILMLGVKPFTGAKNNEVIGLIERGDRLQVPENCPPRLSAMIYQCWAYEPTKRPSFTQIKVILHELSDQLRNQAANSWQVGSRTDPAASDDSPPPKPSLPSDIRSVLSPLANPNAAHNSRSSSSSPSVAVVSSSGKGSLARPCRSLTTEEMHEHEMERSVHNKRMVYLNQRLLQLQLKEQLRISEEDEKWLEQEEVNFRPKSMLNDVGALTMNRTAKKRHNPALKSLCNEVTSAVGVIIKLIESAATTVEFVEAVKNLGGKVRSFSAAVDSLRTELRDTQHDKIESSQNRLSKDMGDVVQTLRLVMKFYGSEVEDGYMQGFVSAVKVVAGDVSDLMELLSDF